MRIARYRKSENTGSLVRDKNELFQKRVLAALTVYLREVGTQSAQNPHQSNARPLETPMPYPHVNANVQSKIESPDFGELPF